MTFYDLWGQTSWKNGVFQRVRNEEIWRSDISTAQGKIMDWGTK